MFFEICAGIAILLMGIGIVIMSIALYKTVTEK